MSDETWINAKKAVELGFADEILFDEKKHEKSEPEKEEETPDQDTSDETDEEGGDDKPDEKKEDKKPLQLGNAVQWEYSTRIMGQTIMGKITAAAKAEVVQQTNDSKISDTPKSSEEGLTDDVKDTAPVIGMDGTTADGSMPYEILKRQLAFMK